jgi:hypothetical protein
MQKLDSYDCPPVIVMVSVMVHDPSTAPAPLPSELLPPHAVTAPPNAKQSATSQYLTRIFDMPILRR